MIALPASGGAVQDAVLVGSAPWMKIVYTNNHLQLFAQWCISIIVILEECAKAAHDLLKTRS